MFFTEISTKTCYITKGIFCNNKLSVQCNKITTTICVISQSVMFQSLSSTKKCYHYNRDTTLLPRVTASAEQRHKNCAKNGVKLHGRMLKMQQQTTQRPTIKQLSSLEPVKSIHSTSTDVTDVGGSICTC